MSDAVMVPREAMRQLRRVAEMDAQADRMASVMIANWIIQDLAASTPVGGWEEPFMYAYECVEDGRWQAYRQQLKRADGSICPGKPLYAAPPPPSVSTDNGSRPQEAVPTEQADRPVWHRADSAGQTLLYTLRQDGWRKGRPIMVNDLEVRIQAANGAAIDLEAIIDTVLAGLQQPADGCSSNEGADGWIEWSGGENPVPGQIVQTRSKFDTVSNPEESERVNWRNNFDFGHIIAYRILPQTEKGS